MTRAATFFPAKEVEPASGDFQTEMNFGAAATTLTATTVAASVSGNRYMVSFWNGGGKPPPHIVLTVLVARPA